MFGPEPDHDPIGVLILAGFMRDDLPWLYEIAVEAYRTIRKGTQQDMTRFMKTLQHVQELVEREPVMEWLLDSQEMSMMVHEVPRMLRHALERALEMKRRSSRRKQHNKALNNGIH